MICTLLASFILGFPPIFDGFQIMWVIWVILPFISGSFLFTTHDPNVMTFMAGIHDICVFNQYFLVKRSKGNKQMTGMWKCVERLAYRFFIIVIVNIAVFGLYFLSNIPRFLNFRSFLSLTGFDNSVNLFGYTSASWPYNIEKYSLRDQVSLSQTITMFLFVLQVGI